ncbi:subunit 2 of transcription factor IIH [Chloropicon primus]|uniref:General transcription factor IIH subunit n=1 Tax=Chloropicon primus TaxID=1764295 RepID=A0A5B8MZS2_9CHLO|nr:subunit 2 of transcription factor IIH [Chloropicon primus]UPR05006.1 subunit 2 of transcription factor IIH [Chloropicon primus]|eukprot:QDZ25811.1 subunit 2 of transcription factor IIH [Chloropicon primus]
MGGTRGRGANASTSRAEEDRAMASAFGGGGGSGGGVTDAGNSAFLSELNQSWKEIEEDEDGNLLVSGSKARDKRLRERREKLLTNASTAKRIRRGMIRFVQVVIDLSRASLISDMRPSRLKVISEELQRFVRTFFDSNPLSQLSLSCTRNGLAKVITELSGSPQKHIDHLKLLGTQKLGLDCTGDASVQNCLDLSLKQLRDVPPYGHREVLFLMTSLTTCDPGDVFASIDQARANKMHCSVIGLGAEVFVLKSLAEKTGGKYHVATSEAHLQNVLDQYAPPPPALEKETPSSLVQMGFPNFVGDHGTRGDALCFVGPESDLSKGKSFTCPRCKARVKDLPQACHVCGLSLVSSAHLARSYHHLFPVPLFLEVGPVKQEQGAANVPKDCSACGKPLESLTLQCPECKELYCITCDVFIHEQLHNCPGCG